MPRAVGGFISGDPEAMTRFSATGPDPGVLGEQPAFTRVGMPESAVFAAVDAVATTELMRFVTEANQGFQSYTTAARASGGAYLDAEAAGEAAIVGVDAGYRG
ncbi:hypothetical protein ACFHW0_25905 [Micromonospora sp. LOL_025]|uniref:hypothetical protein n=1 Tax=Micromonospora sp. LOL_025 TaxID=3345413 RepID=UPI003A86DA2B